MGDDAWEETYSVGKHINNWPWSDVVSLFFRYQAQLPQRSHVRRMKVLELGSGTGNNIAFWKSVGAEYSGVDQSVTAVAKTLEKFPELQNNILVGDFSNSLAASEEFDIICDRAAVTHGTTREISETLKASHQALKEGGLFSGVDWFSKRHSDYLLPSTVKDEHTRSDFMSRQFTGVGKVHFSDRQHLLELFNDFQILELSEKVITKSYPEIDNHVFAFWNIVARKK